MKQLCCFLMLYFALIFAAYSQQYNFTNYSINEGLSQSVVNCVFQDSWGYIWMGTQNGLNRFDGIEFELYRFNPTDSNSISNNWIYSITEDKEGNLWIGTKGGLNKYLRTENKFVPVHYRTGYYFDVTNYSYDNICLKNGNILINTPPVVSIYNPKEQIFSHYTNKLDYDASVKDVKIPALEDNQGNIWVGSSGGLARFSPQTGNFGYCTFQKNSGEVTSEQNITALFQDPKGRMWAGTSEGLFYSDEGSLDFREALFQLATVNSFSFQNCIRSIILRKNGNLLVGTEGAGLFIISPESGNVFNIGNLTAENSGIGHNIVQCLLIDKSENLWAGTLSGISKTDLKPKKFKHYRKSNSPNSLNLLDNVVGGLFKNDDGIIWVGNWGQGLNLVNIETGEVDHFSTQQGGNNYLPNDFVHVIFKDSQGDIWLGTRNGILIFDKQNKRFVKWTDYFNQPAFPAFEDTRIYHIIQDSETNYWVASSKGLFKFNLNNSTMEVFHVDGDSEHHLNANLVYSLLEDSDGLIWIATINGLGIYNPGSGEIKHFTKEANGLSSNFLISLGEDDSGNIWIGSNSFINVYDKQNNKFKYMGEEHGLPSNYIYEIIKDKVGNMWFATGNGLCRLDTKSGQLENFTREDGLQSLEFNLRAAFVCDDGEMLFGGMNGFSTFYPDSIAGNPFVPDLVFTSFSKITNDIQETVNLGNESKVVLDNDVQSFTIKFAALEYTNPGNNHYAYKMEGISDEWVDIGPRNFVPFFALPPGKFTFWVKGSNNDGVWNKQGISVSIVVLPPWWRSMYAYIIYLFLTALVIIALIKLRERRLKLDKLLLEKKVVERTVQIDQQNRIITAKNKELDELNRTKDKFFSIIGHDLRNQFNIIIGFSEALLTGFRSMNESKLEHYIAGIYKSSAQAHDLLGNLLAWAHLQRNAIVFKPEKLNATSKIRELLHFHEEAALKKNILIEVLAREEIVINADVNMFSAIIRNLLANAIKFTHVDGEISVSLKPKNDLCEISVKDSGVGIPTENLEKVFKVDSNISTRGTDGEKGTGLGLVLCKEFVEKHGGRIWLKSKQGSGSEFIFTMPLYSS